jgi:hypothetical protein
VQRIESDDAVRDTEFAKQLLRGGDLVGLLLDIDVCQNQAGFGVERVQQLGRLAVVEIVEASPECFSVERDDALRRINCGVQQTSGVAAENLLDRLRIEALKDVSNGGMRWRTLPAQTEGGVQSAAVYLDEGLDGTIGIAAGDNGKDREQQDMRQLIDLAFGPARVRDLAEQAEQPIERPHGNLLVVWLPRIDSEISPRRNLPPGSPT